MSRLTNEGRIEYKAIIGFKAVRKENGLYHRFATLKDSAGNISMHPLTTCKGERLLDTWMGIRVLANLLTWEDFFIEI